VTTQLCAERSQKERKKASASTQESKNNNNNNNNNNDNDKNDLDTNNASSCMLSSIPQSYSANIIFNINTHQSIQDQDDETLDSFPL
jgi:hypothetical protein